MKQNKAKSQDVKSTLSDTSN